MNELKAIIIDDETNAREALLQLLKLVAPQVQIIGLAKNAEQGIALIENLHPQLVFLDIQMPGKSGFDMLMQIPNINFGVIFTTAYQEFAIKAFRYSAIDYLLKPIDPDNLVEAIVKFSNMHTKIESGQLDIMQQALGQNIQNPYLRSANTGQRLALPSAEGLHLVHLTDIIQCESLGSYTKFHLTNGSKIVVSKVLKEYEDILDGFQFFRVHQSHIVNLDHIKRYIKGDGGQLCMTDNSEIEVSRRRKDDFLALLSAYYINHGRQG